MFCKIGAGKTASCHDLETVSPDHLKRTLDEFRGDAVAAQRLGRLDMSYDHGARQKPIIRKSDPAICIELIAMQCGVVADDVVAHGSHSFVGSRYFNRSA